MRIQKVYDGHCLTLWTLGRQDLIISKLYAACDRNADDSDDLLAMKPSAREIDAARDWIVYLDGNPDWPKHVVAVVERLKMGLL